MRVLIIDADNDLTAMELALLNELRPDWETAFLPTDTPQEKVLRELRRSDLLISAFARLDAAALADPGRLRAISVNAVGYNNVDLDAAARAGLSVFALQDYCTDEVAEHAIALMLALSRRLLPYRDALREENRWSFPCSPRPRRIAGQTLGIFGFGRIGQAVAKRALGLGMQVLVCSGHGAALASRPGNEWMRELTFTTREEILARAEVISNHMAQTAQNLHFFDAAAFAAMKNCPILINTGRGEAVDSAALMDALRSGQIYGAGLDVLEDIPSAQSMLQEDLNLIVTPHAAFYSQQSAERLARDTCRNLIHFTLDEPDEITRILVWKGERRV